jgi:hypothetical protein
MSQRHEPGSQNEPLADMSERVPCLLSSNAPMTGKPALTRSSKIGAFRGLGVRA